MGKASDPPKCKVCNLVHWGTCYAPEPREQRLAKATGALAGKGVDIEAEVARVAAMSPAEVVAASKERKKEITAARKRGRPATGFDKKAYQRELMRKKRAAQKEGKP